MVTDTIQVHQDKEVAELQPAISQVQEYHEEIHGTAELEKTHHKDMDSDTASVVSQIDDSDSDTGEFEDHQGNSNPTRRKGTY